MLQGTVKPPVVCAPPPEDHSTVHVLGCICIKTGIRWAALTSMCHMLAASYFFNPLSLAQQQLLLKSMCPPTIPGLITPPVPGPHFLLYPARIARAIMATTPLPTARLPCPSLTLSVLPGKSPIPARPILRPEPQDDELTPSQTPEPAPPPALFTLS